MSVSKKRTSWVGGGILLLLLAAAVTLPFIAGRTPPEVIWVRARMPEAGGWNPGSLQAAAGKPLHLRLTSDDVMHSFAIGQSDQPPVDIAPGEVTDITLTFDQPGKYTYYCTRWCGVNHWRMRGTIEVSGPPVDGGSSEPPLYARLKIDIDRPHPAAVTPAVRPSAETGQELLAEAPAAIPEAYSTQDYYRANSPAQVWLDLRSQESLQGLADAEIWNLVAALIQAQTSPDQLAEGRRLYAENCAACHGETGAGDGVMAAALAGEAGLGDPGSSLSMPGMGPGFGQSTLPPVDFTDAENLLGASPALLQGKILRGGMGTGMPYWGPIFTDEQTWALVAYIQSFQFELENER